MKNSVANFIQTVLPLILTQDKSKTAFEIAHDYMKKIVVDDWVILNCAAPQDAYDIVKAMSTSFKKGFISTKYIPIPSNLHVAKIEYSEKWKENTPIVFNCDFNYRPSNASSLIGIRDVRTIFLYTFETPALRSVFSESENPGITFFSLPSSGSEIIEFTNINGVRGRTHACSKGAKRILLEKEFLLKSNLTTTKNSVLEKGFILGPNKILYPRPFNKFILNEMAFSQLLDLIAPQKLIAALVCGDMIQYRNSGIYKKISSKIDILENLNLIKRREIKLLHSDIKLLEKELNPKKFVCSNQTQIDPNSKNLFYYFNLFFDLSSKLEGPSFEQFKQLIKYYFANTRIDRELEKYNIDLHLYFKLFVLDKITDEVNYAINQKRSLDHSLVSFWKESLDFLRDQECEGINLNSFNGLIASVLSDYEYRRVPFLEAQNSQDNKASITIVLKDFDDSQDILKELNQVRSVLYVCTKPIPDGIFFKLHLINGDFVTIKFLNGIEIQGVRIIPRSNLFKMDCKKENEFKELCPLENEVLNYVYDTFYSYKKLLKSKRLSRCKEEQYIEILQKYWGLESSAFNQKNIKSQIIDCLIRYNSIYTMLGLKFSKSNFWHQVKGLSFRRNREIDISYLPLKKQEKLAAIIESRQRMNKITGGIKTFKYEKIEKGSYSKIIRPNFPRWIRNLIVKSQISLTKLKGDTFMVVGKFEKKESKFSQSKYYQYKLYFDVVCWPKLRKIKSNMKEAGVENLFPKKAVKTINEEQDPFLDKYFSTLNI